MTPQSDALALCLAGQISPQVALARLLLGGATPATLAAQFLGRPPPPGEQTARWQALCALVESRRAMMSRLAGEIAAAPPEPQNPGATAGIAAFFDHAVAVSPEASVALFSLGDPVILAEATAEIMAWLASLPGAAAAPPDVLDLGCGIGRIAAALAPQCRSLLGLDVSAGMVAEARRRCAGLPNVRLEQTAGTDLDTLPSAAFDLVLAVDSFPYLVQAGADIVTRHVQGAARILRPGGRLVVLNLSYGRDRAADVADVRGWVRYGFTVTLAGKRPFALWDGTAFVLQRVQ